MALVTNAIQAMRVAYFQMGIRIAFPAIITSMEITIKINPK